MASGSVQRSLASIVLGFEVIVVGLGALVLFGLDLLAPAYAFAGGGAVILLMLVTLGILRFRWAYALGWLVQLIVVAAGFLTPAFFFVGALFGALWLYAVVKGSQLDSAHARSASAEEDHRNETEGI